MATSFGHPSLRVLQKNEVINYARNEEGSREVGPAKRSFHATVNEAFVSFSKDVRTLDPS